MGSSYVWVSGDLRWTRTCFFIPGSCPVSERDRSPSGWTKEMLDFSSAFPVRYFWFGLFFKSATLVLWKLDSKYNPQHGWRSQTAALGMQEELNWKLLCMDMFFWGKYDCSLKCKKVPKEGWETAQWWSLSLRKNIVNLEQTHRLQSRLQASQQERHSFCWIGK